MNILYILNTGKKNAAQARVSVVLLSLAFCYQISRCSLRAEAQTLVAQASPRDVWQIETWTKDDASYKKIIADIQQQIASGKKASELAEHAQPTAHKNDATGLPEDAGAVFRFGYAAYRAAKQDQQEKYLADAADAMSRVLPTHSYQFARLHFLLNGKLGDTAGLKLVGQRLLKHDPSDTEVKYYFVLTLHPGKTPTDRRLALTYTAQLIHQFPANPKMYALLGYVYDIANAENHDPKDGDRAITAYRHYLKIAPPDDDFRRVAVSHITSVQMLQRVQRQTQGTKRPSRTPARRPVPAAGG